MTDAMDQWMRWKALNNEATLHGKPMSSSGAIIRADAAIEALEAELANWQQMYREMSAAAENLREWLRCMKPNDVEAKCLSLQAELAEAQGMFQRCLKSENCCQASLEQAEAELASAREECEKLTWMLREALTTYVWDNGSKSMVSVNDPDVLIRKLADGWTPKEDR